MASNFLLQKTNGENIAYNFISFIGYIIRKRFTITETYKEYKNNVSLLPF